ncbi:hypothetical protein B5C34_14365 [Pacificimonas flava]|uniref:Alpha/beta hydrolase n=2 Tax=Pacificimonas TaxID=1960290 RepID=A0A219B819_9SPHN|nr:MULTISPECIES: hypothetical protein [Pacificimonas]MBZ6380009.1 hypothetical protein [Pacificimonas aurantium]OWV34525.1 hypothetical protein B5C34_14365 [Pacificimonas flava]
MSAPRLSLESAGPHRLPSLRQGPGDIPALIVVQPLYEEQNRCRRFLVQLGAALAAHGIPTTVPDLPRSGDSPDIGPFDLRVAKDALRRLADAEATPGILAMRGGALLAAPLARGQISIAPVWAGDRLLRDLVRSHAVAEKERTGAAFGMAEAQRTWREGGDLWLSGHPVSAAAAETLSASVSPCGEVLEAPELGLPPLWRQAEPVEAGEAAARAAERVARWLAEARGS